LQRRPLRGAHRPLQRRVRFGRRCCFAAPAPTVGSCLFVCCFALRRSQGNETTALRIAGGLERRGITVHLFDVAP
jgi:hypothetical protein